MSLASLWVKTLFPLWERWIPSDTSKPGAMYAIPLLKNPKLWWWHQTQSHVLIDCVRLFLPMSLPATERREEKITCAPDSLTNRPEALEYLLIALGNVRMCPSSLCCMPIFSSPTVLGKHAEPGDYYFFVLYHLQCANYCTNTGAVWSLNFLGSQWCLWFHFPWWTGFLVWSLVYF